ncbi:NRDE family protein [Roseivirga sp.]|uniref:NRDE family protein n=1 Tax=Roseivirga sp. TaxID=1964215 RepID=UPI003B51A130
MCTVTFLPKKNRDFILTSNRDEDPSRASHELNSQLIEGREVRFPKDPKAGGTWFATDEDRFTLCLLNGAFEKHQHRPPYRLSRGIMLLDFFEINHVESFVKNYDFDGIEPFTLVLIDHSEEELRLNQLVWNENELNHQVLNQDSPYIWSSSTLYPQPVRDERRKWFNEWLKGKGSFNQDEILSFHQFGGKGDAWNDFVMNREGKVKTVSVTSLDKRGAEFSFEHLSLI